MTTQVSRRPTRTGPSAMPIAVLVASILQVVAPVVTINGPGSSPGEGSGPELLITPVGWAFSIWGVIYTLAIAHAVAALVTRSPGSQRRQVAQLVLYLGGAVWIVLAGLDSSLATAGALTVMFVAAVVAVLTVVREPIEPAWLRRLTRAAVGLYAGWVTAAFFLNVSTALVDAGAVEADVLSWQVAILVLAIVTLIAMTVAVRGTIAYAAAGVWALIGISVTARDNGDDLVITVALVAVVLLAAVTAALALRHRRAPLPVL